MKILMVFFNIFLYKNCSIEAQLTSKDNNLNKIDTIPAANAFTQRLQLIWQKIYMRRFLKIFQYIFLRKNAPPPLPNVATPYPRRSWFEQTWMYITWGSFLIRFNFICQLVIEKKNFKMSIKFPYFRAISPLSRGGPSFEQTWISLA